MCEGGGGTSLHGKAVFETEHKELLNSLYECPHRR